MDSGQGPPTQPFVGPEARTNDTVAETPTRTGFTLRISSIPSSITEEQFLGILNDLPCDACRNDNQPNVLGYSYTLPVASIDHQTFRTATVTFRSIPSGFKTLTSTPINLFGETSSTTVDSHFYGLTPLNNPPQEPIADLIAVTGLAGHAFGSWKSRGGYKMWLRDFLPTHMPNVRILTYGYDSTLFENSSTASIIEFSRNFLETLKVARSGDKEKSRPIVFIGHSLGGLVIKQALVTASQGGDEDKSILSSCHALLLFGVPHKGLKVEHLRSMVKGQPNSRLIEDLNDEPSNFLRLLHDSWKPIRQKGTRVVSVYETKQTPTVQETSTGWKKTGPEVLMVSRDSAIHATPEKNESDIFSIDANHSDIVKFNNDACQDYLTVRSKVVDLVQGLHEMYVLLPEKKRNDILGWLSKIEYIKHHENAKEGLLENTGQWLLQRVEFREWRSSEVSSILWLHGIPGAGKTKLTCMVTDTLKSAILEDKCQKNEPVVYFYCNRNEPLRRDPEAVLQAFVKQLSLAHPDLRGLPRAVVEKYDKRVKDGFASGSLSFEESHQLVLLLLRLHRQTTVIIDALDECDPGKRLQLLEVLKGVIQPIGSESLVKVFISSRDDIDITLKLEDVPNLYINARDNNRDIERFVKREVAQCIENGWLLCGHVTNELRLQVISSIVTKAKGMFQWADLQIKHLCQMSDEDDMKENLGRLPETLEEAYSRIYTAILSEKPRAQELTKKALMWVMCSQRVLTREEWAEATYWPKDVPNGSVSTLFKLCRNLVTWDSQSNAMRFAHLSVREYLESQFSSTDANSMAARCCLEQFNPLYSQKFEVQNLSPPRIALAKYSTIYWPDHVKYSYEGARHMSRDMLGLLQGFLGTPPNPGEAYRKWYQIAAKLRNDTGRSAWSTPLLRSWPRSYFFRVESVPLNPLFAMSYVCFGKELMELWQHESASISSEIMRDTPLLEYIASKRGGEWVVDFLFEEGDPQRPTTSLSEAIYQKHGRVVLLGGWASGVFAGVFHTRMLLKEITEDILKGLRGWREMELVRCRDVNTIKLLLLGDVNAEVTEAAVAVAARMCDAYTIQMLLANNPNIKTTEMVLMAAADNRHSDKIIEMLLAQDLNTEIITEAVLKAALNNQHTNKIIETLLAKDLNTEAITEAVLKAALDSHTDKIIEMLLAQDLNTEIITEAVLIAAAGNGRGERVMGMLLAKDLNIEAITEAVLIAAVRYKSNDKIMGILLAKNPKIEVITEAVLIAAVGNENGVQAMAMLLTKNPNIKITEAILIAAAGNRWSSEEIVGILLAKNPKIKVITEAVLIAAARNENGVRAMMMLWTKNPNIKITEAILMAVGNKWNCKEFMGILLAENPKIEVIAEAVIAAAGSANGAWIMVILLTKNPNIKITEAILIAAAGNKWSSEEIVGILLAKNPRIEAITEAVLIAAARNENGVRATAMLLTKNLNIKITEAILIAAVENKRNCKEIVGILLAKNPKIEVITEAVLIAAAGNENGVRVMAMLLTKNPNIKITEAILIAAAENKWRSEEIMGILLAKNPRIEVITEAVLIAAAGNENGAQAMAMLWTKNPNLKITEAILMAVGNKWNCKKFVGILLAENPKIEVITEAVMAVAGSANGAWIMVILLAKYPIITEAVAIGLVENLARVRGTPETNLANNLGILNSEAVLIAVARHCQWGDKMMDALLRTGHRTEITEEVIIAAAGNQRRGKEILSILLGKNPKIEITEAVVTAAAQRWGRQDIIKLLVKEANLTEGAAAAVAKISSKTVMEELLAKNIEITEMVLIAATKNKWSGKQTVMLLLDKNPNIEITEAVMAAAAENDREGGEIMKMLLTGKKDIEITQTVLAAAAGNEWSAKEITEALRNIKITDAAVPTAKHGRSGERILEAPPTKRLKTEPTVAVNDHLSPAGFEEPNLEQ